jgi:hypothetical protein
LGKKRHFSTLERIEKVFLRVLAFVCPLFLGLFSKSVSNLLIKPKENVNFAVLVPSSSYVYKIAKTSVEVIAEPTKSTRLLPLKNEEGSKTIFQDQEKIVYQVNASIDQLEDRWVRERLFQISKFFLQKIVWMSFIKHNYKDICILLISIDLRNRGVPPQVSKTFQKPKNLIFVSNEDLQKKNIEQELKAADLIINIINIPHRNFPNPGNKPILRVEEYGFNPSNAFALGLSPHSYSICIFH